MFIQAFLIALISPDTTRFDNGIRHISPEPMVADISGYYICKGTESGGRKYKGVTVITKQGNVYVVQWLVGKDSFTGIGIRQGDTFAVGWAMPGDKGLMRGINFYNIYPGPHLIGRWATLPGGGVVQSETLFFLKELEEEN